jgi:hypothetical protein
MSFTTIGSSSIATGEPGTNTLWTQVKDNFDNHETRISDVESGNTTVYPPIILCFNGDYTSLNGLVGVIKTTLNFNLTVTGVRLLIDKCGSSGTTEIDIKFKRAAGAWTSILTTKPTVAYGAGDDAVSSNGVVNGTYDDLQAGDLLRVDITSVQAHGRTFYIRLDFNKA